MIDINKLEPGARYKFDGKLYETKLNARIILSIKGNPCPECAFHVYNNELYFCGQVLDIIFGSAKTGARTHCGSHFIFVEVQE